jgi:hypothetical protein
MNRQAGVAMQQERGMYQFIGVVSAIVTQDSDSLSYRQLGAAN